MKKEYYCHSFGVSVARDIFLFREVRVNLAERKPVPASSFHYYTLRGVGLRLPFRLHRRFPLHLWLLPFLQKLTPPLHLGVTLAPFMHTQPRVRIFRSPPLGLECDKASHLAGSCTVGSFPAGWRPRHGPLLQSGGVPRQSTSRGRIGAVSWPHPAC